MQPATNVWKWFRWGFYTVFGLFGLAIVAIVVALMVVDTEALKRQLETRVEAETGRELRIDGPLEISFYPVLGFSISDVEFANAPGFGEEPLAAFDRALLRARILPLLTGEIAIDTASLQGLRLNAARNAEGRTNWADLVERGAGEDEAPTEPTTDAPGANDAAAADGGSSLQLSIRAVEVRDANLTWKDAVSGQNIELRDFSLTLHSLRAHHPSRVIVSGTLVQDGVPALNVEAITRLTLDLAAPSALLDNLEIHVTGQGNILPPGAVVSLRGDLNVDAGQGVATFDRAALRVLGAVVARGAVNARFGGEAPSFDGNLDVEPFSPAKLATAARVSLPERADPDSLSEASLSLQFAGNTESVTVESFEGQLDDTTFSGQARARFAGKPSVEFSLDADAIDLDRYLPPRGGADGGNGEDASAGGGQGGNGAGGDPIADLPLEMLQAFNGQGDITLGRLQWRGLPMEDIRLQARLADGVLDLTRADLRVAGGSIGASGRLDAADTERPGMRFQAQLNDIQSEPVLAAVLDSTPVTGMLNASTNLATAGATLDDWIGALDGKLQANFADGTVAGINIAQRLRVAVARLQGGQVDQAAEARSTDFSSLRISATIDDGVAQSNDLDLRTPLLRAGGSGRVDLAARTLDYTLRIRPTGTIEGRDLSEMEIPLRFSGNLVSPSIDLGLGDAIEQRAKQEIEQEKQEAKKKARQKLEEEGKKAEERLERELRDELKGLFE